MIVFGSNTLFSDAVNTMRREQGLPPVAERTPEQREAERLAEAERRRRGREAFLATVATYDLADGRIGRVHFLRGRCANGSEGGPGRLLHIVPDEFGAATLCGAQEGFRSAGWSEEQRAPATCPRCLARLARMGGRLLPPAA